MSLSDEGFILSGHSETQLQLLHGLRCEESRLLLHVEGPHRIWINKSPVHYFSLRLAPTDDTRQTDEGTVP